MKKRSIACVAAVVVALSAHPLALASAAEKTVVAQATHESVSQRHAGLIDSNRQGTLVIHKSSGDPLTQFGDPQNPTASLDRSPIPGIRFEARKVMGIDLTTNEGWLAAENVKAADFYAGGGRESDLSTTVVRGETGPDGSARLANLPLGLYYVTEAPSPAQDKHLSVVSPFLVTVPTTDLQTRGRWMYEVEVHAKDQKLTTTADVDKRCTDVGGTVTYTVTGNSPAPQSDGKIHRYTIANPVPDGVTVKDSSHTVTISNRATGGKTVELDKRKDYTFTVDAQRVATMELTPAGLTKLAASRKNNPDTVVSVSFAATVKDKPESGYVRDTGYLLTEGYPVFVAATKPGVNSNEVKTAVPCNQTPEPRTKKPGVPPASGDPRTPEYGSNVPAQVVAQPERQRGVEKLAMTGSSVLGLVLLGAVLTVSGGVLLRRRLQ